VALLRDMPESTDSTKIDQPAVYSALQVKLHWIVLLLVLLQLWSGDAMHGVMQTLERQEAVDAAQFLFSSIHSYVGLTILCLMLWRLYLRIRSDAFRGSGGISSVDRQVAPPRALQLLGRLNHAALYLVTIVLGISGGVTYFAEIPAFGRVHSTLAWIFQGLLLLHVIAAAYHALIRRDQVLARMRPWGRSDASVRDARIDKSCSSRDEMP